MDLGQAMQELEGLGSEQTRRTFLRHGAAEPLFGVKFGDLGKLAKRIKVDHQLAKALWATGNHDARLLACMVADAGRATAPELKAWAGAVKDAGTAEALAAFAARTPAAAALREAWLADPKLQRAGWSLVAHLAAGKGAKDAAFDEAAALDFLKRIEAGIHGAENWTRRTMMYALLGIGGRSAALRQAAEAALRRIGPVAFDPGNTACEFPDPLPYLERMWARKK
jgi:3-methyladenine DNA glycosylase AlkD